MSDNTAWSDAGEPESITPDEPATVDRDRNETPDADLDDSDRGELIAESKKYRQRAQAAEGERDALRGRLESAQRAQVLALAAGLSEPADVFSTPLGGADLDDLLDDDGLVDPGKVRATVDAVVLARPGLARDHASTALFGDVGQGRTKKHRPEKSGPTWAEVLKPTPGIS
ncbi:hypothetical protein [Gordonia polyisoprenivorans]|uniref:hypothetical protein n=1 Tax=Gordonia polyisoprenivorans TaxID=84595 RepID=UPI001AD71243|nr:hypothetical protein [Gordonia polyisoprenivorans]QTI67652.1 hypothetical protein J6U32_19030 [Gordonia polyisoprenivorans]